MIPVLAALLALAPLTPASATDLADAASQARTATTAFQSQSLDRALAEAQVVKGVMEDCLQLVYFPGMWELADEAVTIKAEDTQAYRAVSARLAFLRGAPGSQITLKPADRATQFEALKSDYRAALERAGAAQRSLGERRQLVWALAEWGSESIVSSDGKNYVQVLTREQRDGILAP